MNNSNRIILTEKAAELLKPEHNNRPSNSLSNSMTASHRSEKILQKINAQVAALMNGHTSAVREQKEKNYVLNKLRSTFVGNGQEQSQPSPYILNKIDAIATKLSKSSTAKGNVSEYALGSSSAYIQRLQALHDKSMEKYQSMQEKLEQQRAHDTSGFNVDKPDHFDASETHYKTRFQERLKRQRERKYKGLSQMKLPDVPAKYQLNWQENEERVRNIKQKYLAEREQMARRNYSNTIIAQKGYAAGARK